MADGAARAATVLQLSHWPRSSTPEHLRADLSAEIVVRAIDEGCIGDCGAEVATIDHYDEDGLVSLAMLVEPNLAERHSEVLVSAASCGDFGVVRSRHGALVCFALSSLVDPFGPPVGTWSPAARQGLSLIEDLATDPGSHEELWREEAAAYDAAVGGIGGWVTVEELPEHDLAVVRVDTTHAGWEVATWRDHAVHPAAVNSSTAMLRIATIAGDRFELRFRYETWVRLASHRPRLRVDLGGFARSLTEEEPAGALWSFDGPNAIVPELRRSVDAGLSPDTVLEKLLETLPVLDTLAPAWDPYV
jgi:Family of unknown function (DUF6687)